MDRPCSGRSGAPSLPNWIHQVLSRARNSPRRDEPEGTEAKARADAVQAQADERLDLKNTGQKGPQHL